MRFSHVIAFFWLFAPLISTAQERSPVLKDPAGQRSPFYLKIDRSTEELFNAFLLVKKANSGDPVAEHELGLRYLTGQAFTPDTDRAATWIGRAAGQEYVPAIYNYGILQNNGWGTPWDPFGAFINFQTAARKGLVEGMYMYGLFLTDNLVVPRDYASAYRWIRTAADSGYTIAGETLEDFRKTGILTRMLRAAEKNATPPPTSQQKGQTKGRQTRHPTLQPVFLDMETDTLADPDDTTLIDEAFLWNSESMAGDTGAEKPGPHSPDSIDVVRLLTDASGTAPEALTLTARRAQMGWGIPPDTLEASITYIRAIRCASRWSPVLLWRLVQTPGYFERLQKAIVGAGENAGSPGATATKAGYLWASLVAMGFDGQLTDEQALGHLRTAAAAHNTDALIGLGLCYYAGYWVGMDAGRGDSLMKLAAGMGSREAEVRLAMSRLRGAEGGDPEPGLVEQLLRWDDEGSVLARVMLGYCYEVGAGVEASLPVAVAYYRKAAQRGSRVAFDALRRLYDEHRPDEEIFRIPGQ